MLNKVNQRASIRFAKSDVGLTELLYVSKVMRSQRLGMGSFTAKFESLLSEFVDREVVCVNSGTSALQIALQGLGIGSGDEVLVPTVTYVATFQAISATGAKPIPCDVNEQNLQIDLEDAQKRISLSTKAIVPVLIAGDTRGVLPAVTFAERNGLHLVFDAAHAFGSIMQNGEPMGQIDAICCFSFDGIKHLTCGEGGAITTNNVDLADRCRDLCLLGIEGESQKRRKNDRLWDFDVKNQGWRMHLSNINASIGIAQLKSLEKRISRKKKIFNLYYDAFHSTSMELFDWNQDKGIAPFIFSLKLPHQVDRNHLRTRLLKKGIETGVNYKPNHLLTKFSDKAAKLPTAESLYPRIISLPLHSQLREDKARFVVESVLAEIDALKR